MLLNLVKSQLRAERLRILSAFLIAAATPQVSAQELRLEVTGRRNPLTNNLFPLIFGKLDSQGIIVGENSWPFELTVQPQSLNTQKPITLSDPKIPNGDPQSTAERRIAPASFSVKNLEDPQCLESKNVREIFFLLGLLKEEIGHLSISSPRDTVCFQKLAAKLSGLSRLDTDSDPLKDKIRIRIHFAATPGQPTAQQQAPGPMRKSDQLPKASDPAPALTAADQGLPVTLTINGETVETDKDGWFVYEPASTDIQIVAVRQGSRTLLLKSYSPIVLKAGTTERQTPHYRYIYLVTNAARALASIAPERLDLKKIVGLSLPFFLKGAYGNTRLYPLPGEGKVDRPTFLAGVKSHPILYGMHIESDGFISYKPDSQIPWTALITGVIGNDFVELGNDLSVPWGVGGRAFKSEIDTTKASSEDADESASGRILIPESVLGPAATLGIRYRNNYIYSEAKMTVTPLKLPGSDLIVTYNPSVYLGFQLTGADTITLNYQTHDVRFPTKTKVVRVTASIVALGYMRDLR